MPTSLRMGNAHGSACAARSWYRIACGLLAMSCTLFPTACRRSDVRAIRIAARPAPPTTILRPGRHALGLGRVLYRGSLRDGTLYVPKDAGAGRPVPLLVLLHGGGGAAREFDYVLPIADEFGVALLNLDARHNTWDGVDSPFGPDVQFIDEALRYAFAHVSVDPAHVALGGQSDGGMYALSVGRVNGDVFTHLIAVAPGFMVAPAPAVGSPRIFLAHGTRDTVYSVTGSRTRLLPRLRADGYDVTYYEFDGPHWFTPAAARAALRWFVEARPATAASTASPGR
jgi:phospholipase/carboxylesterase